MNSDRINAYGLHRPILFIDFNGFQSIECVKAINQFPKNRKLAIQMRLFGVDDVELGEIGVWTFVGDGKNASSIVF